MARKILLADDSVTAQNMGRRILTDAGYEVTTVNNGSAALKRIAESKPDLIVLDVYMPGYSGLEVCQRIRESRETARIPVLLTVGKLEPFKPEEVRRVRADAFIVKPFEASELLTALTKLEDKIVPGPQPHKPGRFAKAMAAAEEADEFGDVESGWKNRLKIPPPQHGHQEATPSETATISEYKIEERVQAGLSKAADAKSGIPGDITPEEICAINAAAAAFQAQDSDSPAKPETEHRSGAQSGSDVSAGLASQPVNRVSPSEDDTQEIRISIPPAEPAGETPQVHASGHEQKSPQVEQVEVTGESVAAPDRQSREEESKKEKLADHEVTAALASLAPAEGHAPATQESVAAAEPAPITMAAAGSGEQFSGPRWVAESVMMNEAESALNLDQEMQKSFAAFAAADAAQSGAETAQQHPDHSGLPATQAATAAEEVAPQLTAPVTSSAGNEGHAYAAAAGASSGAAEPAAVADDSSSCAQSGQPDDAATETLHPKGETELAAAWANWKQIRDSVTSPQFTSQIADSASAALHDVHQEETGKPEPHSDAKGSGEENGTIALIVDSVLAEIKPKLMQEIARKMGREKK